MSKKDKLAKDYWKSQKILHLMKWRLYYHTMDMN